MHRTEIVHNKIDKLGRFFKAEGCYNALEDDDNQGTHTPSSDQLTDDGNDTDAAREGVSPKGSTRSIRKPLATLSLTTPDGFPVVDDEGNPVTKALPPHSNHGGHRRSRRRPKGLENRSKSVPEGIKPARRKVSKGRNLQSEGNRGFLEPNHIERLLESSMHGKDERSERSGRSAFSALAAAANDNTARNRSVRRSASSRAQRSSLQTFLAETQKESDEKCGKTQSGDDSSKETSETEDDECESFADFYEEDEEDEADSIISSQTSNTNRVMSIKTQRVDGRNVHHNAPQNGQPQRALAAWELRERAKSKPVPRRRRLSKVLDNQSGDEEDSYHAAEDWNDWQDNMSNETGSAFGDINTPDSKEDLSVDQDDCFGSPIVHTGDGGEGGKKKLSAWELRERCKNQRKPAALPIAPYLCDADDGVPSAFRSLGL